MENHHRGWSGVRGQVEGYRRIDGCVDGTSERARRERWSPRCTKGVMRWKHEDDAHR